MCRRTAGRFGGQDAAAGGSTAGHGCGRCGRRGGPGQQRAGHLPAGSDVATMSLLGYDPTANFTGRAPLEAAAQGIELGPHDWAIRCNLVTIEDQIMRDFTADHISTAEAAAVAADGAASCGTAVPGSSSRGQLSQPAAVSRPSACTAVQRRNADNATARPDRPERAGRFPTRTGQRSAQRSHGATASACSPTIR